MTRVILTLSSGALAGLAPALASDGIQVEVFPLLQFEPPADWSSLDRALAALDRYRAVAFTSPRAAEAVAGRLQEGPKRPGERGPAIWTTGPATRAPLGTRLGTVRMPAEHDARGRSAGSALAHAMLAAGTGSPVLYPCGETHRDEFPGWLREAGITVDEVICYRSVLAPRDVAGETAARADVLVVGSPRVAELLAAACPPDRRPLLLALGPTTAAASRRFGWVPHAEAERPTVEEVAQLVRILGATP